MNGLGLIGLYRDVWIAAIASIQDESGDSNGGNVYYVTMRITFVTRKFGNVERNSHCDVHITPVRVARLVLDCNGVFAIKAYDGHAIAKSRRSSMWTTASRRIWRLPGVGKNTRCIFSTTTQFAKGLKKKFFAKLTIDSPVAMAKLAIDRASA